jgi:hypothetical protein
MKKISGEQNFCLAGEVSQHLLTPDCTCVLREKTVFNNFTNG